METTQSWMRAAEEAVWNHRSQFSGVLILVRSMLEAKFRKEVAVALAVQSHRRTTTRFLARGGHTRRPTAFLRTLVNRQSQTGNGMEEASPGVPKEVGLIPTDPMRVCAGILRVMALGTGIMWTRTDVDTGSGRMDLWIQNLNLEHRNVHSGEYPSLSKELR